MDDNENPYQILGVPQNASTSQIKAAYRKLALKHHPDRQPDDNSKRQAGEIFAKISNAYEIVGDENNRRVFDAEQQHAQDQRNFQRNNHPHFHHQFHDPFQVFAQAFADEFGNSQRSRGMDPFFSGFSPFGGSFFGSPFGQQQQQRGGFGQRDPFADPFFSDPFGRSMGGGGFDLFSQMQQQMDMMRQQSGQGFSSSSFQSSSSSSFSGGTRESVSTTTRIVNGKRKTITERVVTKPDGTVERHVETTGDDDFPGLQQQEQQLLEQGWHGQEPQLENNKKKRTKARYK
jgi:curved DNA-binding protein CbpA